jgi:hypothetical protein
MRSFMKKMVQDWRLGRWAMQSTDRKLCISRFDLNLCMRSWRLTTLRPVYC